MTLPHLFLGPNLPPTVGPSATIPTLTPTLGDLAGLLGAWHGTGFSLIALPNFGVAPFRLQVNPTIEQFNFEQIVGAVPDRGSVQPDIFYAGLTYRQQVSDARTKAGLHVEAGMMLNVPATTNPADPPMVVRQSVVPHGDSLLAQGPSLVVPGGPTIAAANPLPVAVPPATIPFGYTDPYFRPSTPFPPGFDMRDPNSTLRTAIAGQKITSTVVLEFSTANPPSGILNIPFVTKNANATRLDSTFWIETVQPAAGHAFQQLQYTQTIILNFEGINWPHITLATLLRG